MKELSQDLAIALINSTEVFTVNFDDAWQWIGYSSKQKAKNKLTNNFIQDVDYQINQVVVMASNRAFGSGRPTEQINLTVDAFKSFCMMAGTSKGRLVRQHFLECERIALSKSSNQLTVTSSSSEMIKVIVLDALAPLIEQLNEIQQQLKLLPGTKPKHSWILPADTLQEEVPQDYTQIEDGSWLSPEAYSSSKRQSQRSLPWELREIRKRGNF